MFLLFHLLLFNCIISIWLIIGVFLNNGWFIIICIIAKIGFPPFIILFIYIWMGSNWWFIGVDMMIKLGYVYLLVLIMDWNNWVYYMEMVILVVMSYSWMYNNVRWLWTMKVLVMISGIMNGMVMYNCVLVCVCVCVCEYVYVWYVCDSIYVKIYVLQIIKRIYFIL